MSNHSPYFLLLFVSNALACSASEIDTLAPTANGHDAGSPQDEADASPPAEKDAAPPAEDAGPPPAEDAAPPANCTGLFPQQHSLIAGAGTNAIAIVDFDLDGKLDIVATNGSANSVSLFLGKGSGAFQAQTTFDAGATPYWIAADDLNGDGLPDLAVANNAEAPGTVSVLLNQGADAIGSPVSYPVGANPQSLGIADFNEDTKPDVLVCNDGDFTATLLLNEGAGVLAAQPALSLQGATTVALADLNGDHHIDAAIVGDNVVLILLGRGDGTFQTAVSYPAGQLANFIAAADLNGDGTVDLAVTNLEDNTVSVLLGNGNGTFEPQTAYPTVPGPSQVIAADFDGDGRLDLAVAGTVDGIVSILLGQAGGGFESAQSSTTFTTGGTDLWGLAAADLDGDGRVDLAAADVTGGQVHLLLSKCERDAGPTLPTDASSGNDAAAKTP